MPRCPQPHQERSSNRAPGLITSRSAVKCRAPSGCRRTAPWHRTGPVHVNYRFRCRFGEEPNMGYITNRNRRWFAISYEGLDPVTGRDRRRWHRADDEADARTRAGALPSARPPSPRGSRCPDTCAPVGLRRGDLRVPARSAIRCTDVVRATGLRAAERPCRRSGRASELVLFVGGGGRI